MSDPYKVLGVSPSASDEEVKGRLQKARKKISSRPVCGQPAFGAGERKDEGDQRGVRHDRRAAQEPHDGRLCVRRRAQQRLVELQRRAQLHHVRPHCGCGAAAFNGVPVESRNAEWYFLKGTVLYRRGWLEEAKEHFTRAARWTRETRSIRLR
jgi:molecular chaperone DnaJ